METFTFVENHATKEKTHVCNCFTMKLPPNLWQLQILMLGEFFWGFKATLFVNIEHRKGDRKSMNNSILPNYYISLSTNKFISHYLFMDLKAKRISHF